MEETGGEEGASSGTLGGLGTDGRFISIKPYSFRATFTKRIFNTLTEGEYFFPMYQYLLPYLAILVGPSTATMGGLNQIADVLLSKASPIFNSIDNVRTKMKISHIQSLVQNSSDVHLTDNVAGNNSPYINVGKDTINLWNALPCKPNLDTTVPLTEQALHTNNLHAAIHNGGVYLSQSEFNRANTVATNYQGFGVQGAYSMFSDVQTLQSGGTGSYEINNKYFAPSGMALAVPACKGLEKPEEKIVLNPRWPAPTKVLDPFNENNTTFGGNPSDDPAAAIRVSDTGNRIPHGNTGAAVCLWVNPLNPDADATTASQKLAINFMLELECSMDIYVNYAGGDSPDSTVQYQSDNGSGKLIAIPAQEVIPSTGSTVASYWALGDGLRPVKRNVY